MVRKEYESWITSTSPRPRGYRILKVKRDYATYVPMNAQEATSAKELDVYVEMNEDPGHDIGAAVMWLTLEGISKDTFDYAKQFMSEEVIEYWQSSWDMAKEDYEKRRER